MFTGRLRSFRAWQTGLITPPCWQFTAADERMALENARDAYTRRSEDVQFGW